VIVKNQKEYIKIRLEDKTHTEVDIDNFSTAFVDCANLFLRIAQVCFKSLSSYITAKNQSLFSASVVEAIIPIARDLSSLSLIHYFKQDEINPNLHTTNNGDGEKEPENNNETKTGDENTIENKNEGTKQREIENEDTKQREYENESEYLPNDYDTQTNTNPSRPHQDTGILTFGVVSQVPGLRMLSANTKSWLNVEELYTHKTILLWMGEKVPLFAGTKEFLATTHQVILNKETERTSMIFLYDVGK